MYPQGNMNMNTGFYDLPNRPYQLVQANPNYNTPYFGPGTYGNVIR